MFPNNLLKSLPFIFIFFFFFLPPIDTDLGWHLRYGEYFLKTGTWLRENEFTYFLEDYLWPNPFVGYEILVAPIYKFTGLVGLSFAFASFMTLTFWFYNRMNPKLSLVNLVAFLAVTTLGWHVFALGMRAQIFSFLGIVVLLFILQKLDPPSHKASAGSSPSMSFGVGGLDKHPKIAILLPLLFFFWANTHGGFVLGLTIMAAAVLQKLLNKERKHAFTLFLAGIASGTIALFNFFGSEIYQEAFRHTSYPLDKLIAEWVPPSFEVKVLITTMLLIVVLLVVNSANRQKFFWISLAVLFAILILKARRFMPYFGIVSVLAIITSYEQWFSKIEQNLQKYAAPLLSTGSLILFFWIVPRTLNIDTNWKEYCNANKVKQPCRAVEFIRTNPPEGTNVFTAYEWGGFLEWQLPQYKPFVDGRMPAWNTPEGKSPYTVYLEIIQAQQGYQETLDKYNTDWLLIGSGTFLDIELINKPEQEKIWQEVYRDKTVVIYTKEL